MKEVPSQGGDVSATRGESRAAVVTEHICALDEEQARVARLDRMIIELIPAGYARREIAHRGERSSDDRRGQGGIVGTGNAYLHRILVEMA